jgi:hypothetical protein
MWISPELLVYMNHLCAHTFYTSPGKTLRICPVPIEYHMHFPGVKFSLYLSAYLAASENITYGNELIFSVVMLYTNLLNCKLIEPKLKYIWEMH